MGSHIAALGKRLATDVAAVRALACVATLVGLEIAELRESLTARWFLAELKEKKEKKNQTSAIKVAWRFFC